MRISTQMKEQKSIADRLRELKRGESFTVKSETERQAVCRIAKVLKDAGYLPFQIVTKKEDKHFKVAAI